MRQERLDALVDKFCLALRAKYAGDFAPAAAFIDAIDVELPRLALSPRTAENLKRSMLSMLRFKE